MYHSRLQSLPVLDVAPVWAVLKRLDGDGVYTFLINPSSFSITRTTALSTLTPLGASKPVILPQTQSYGFTLPVLLTSPGNNRDFTDDIALLNTLSRLSPEQTLPKLSFTWGAFTEPLCCITSFTYTVVQWRSGKPTQVTGSITIQPYQEQVKPELFKEDKVKAPKIALSAREQAKIAEIMKSYEDRYNDIRVNGEIVEGINRKTLKRERIFTIRDAVRI